MNIKKLLKIFSYFFSPIIIFLIIILRPIKKIRFSFISSQRLGDYSVSIEIYLCEKLLFKSNKYLDIFILTDKISNFTYTELLKKKVIIYPNFITFPLYSVLLFLSKKFFFFKKFLFVLKNKDNNFSILQSKINFSPDSKFITKGNNFLKKIGITEDDKIICLIVRDSNYLKKQFPYQDWNYHNYRNCDINNYKLAINTATKRGYYVLRMGQDNKEELTIPDNPRFIDYGKKFRTDFLDIFLAYKCSFCITTATGWDFIPAFTFRKPVIFTNYTPVGDLLTYSKNFLFSIKIHYDIIKNKKLNLKEISQSLAAYGTSTELFERENIKLLENTPEDLEELTIEMMDRLENNFYISSEDKKLHDIFWLKYVQYFNLNNAKVDDGVKIEPLWCTSNRLYKGKIISNIGNKFLLKHKFLIEQ